MTKRDFEAMVRASLSAFSYTVELDIKEFPKKIWNKEELNDKEYKKIAKMLDDRLLATISAIISDLGNLYINSEVESIMKIKSGKENKKN